MKPWLSLSLGEEVEPRSREPAALTTVGKAQTCQEKGQRCVLFLKKEIGVFI